MKKYFLFLILGTICSFNISAQKTYTFPATPNEVKTYTGDLAEGSIIADMSFAWNSSVACFPGTELQYFTGNQVFYVTTIPAHSEMTITVIPENKEDNMSIYAYEVGENNKSMPPDLTSCVACESERKWDRPKVGKTQDHTRSVYLNAVQNPYRVVIAVVGAEGLKTGKFTLKVDLKSEVPDNTPQDPVTSKTIEVKANSANEFRGDLSEGVFIRDLSWAETSSMACFPGTQNTKFRGKHVLYTTVVPENMDITITVIPDDKNANFSIYAIQTGLTATALPPDISSCIACEAEFKWDYPKVNRTQDHTRFVNLNSLGGQYRIVVGVCGADKLETGGFTLKFDIKPL
jgi:hypothetical protein